MGKQYLISDFLKRFKRPIELEPNKEYKLVTISSKHRGIKLRHYKKGSLIKSNMYEVKSGDFVLSGIDARNGAFGIIPKELDGAIITNDFWCIEINESIISKELFLELTATTWFDELCNRGSDGTTNRVRLQKGKFFNQKVVLPLKSEQKVLLKKLLSVKKSTSSLNIEIQSQKQLITQLKQAILQEAIQGKLTQEWREKNLNTESASELLERIKAEKKQLVKDKKIRKEKPLPPITKEEIPFEIPDGWAWCRIGDISENKTGNSINKQIKESKYKIINDGLDYIGTKDVPFSMSSINYETGVKIPVKETENQFKVAENRSIFICIEGGSSGKKIGYVEKNVCYGNKLLACTPYLKEISKYFYYLFYSSHFQNEFKEQSKGLRGGVSVNSFKHIKIPVPPFDELLEIVGKIEILMEKCNALEQEIEHSEQHTNMLMQAVLKEAFESETEQKMKVVKLNTKPTNIDYYKRTLLATEIVWQLHKEPTLGHLKLQKLMYLAQESGNMQLPTNFLQQVAGPYDPQMARSLDKQMKAKKWFEYKKTEMLKFKPLAKAGEHKTDFEKFFANEIDSIQYIIDTFKTAKSDQVEIVGTLYACWNKLIDEKQIISDELLTKRFYEWSEEKAKFEKTRIIKAIRWMETKGIVPE